MINKKRLAFIWIGLMTLVGCSSDQAELLESPYRDTEFLLGTVVNLSIYDSDKEYVLEQAFDRIEELENIISDEISSTEVSEINRKAGTEPVQVSDELYYLIEKSIEYGDLSNGSFDITVGPLTNLWRIGFSDARKPDQQEIDQVLPLIDHEKIQLNPEKQSVFLLEEDMQLDFGAIAKGYITDDICKLLADEGVTSAIIDLGGNIFVMGHRPTGDLWTVGIQNPFLARGEIVGRIKVSDQSIVTSGIYERYLEVDGTQYHHLLDPNTGYPFDNEIAGVTIVSDASIDGDALSTVVFSKGLDQGLDFIESFDGAEAIFVTKDQKIILSSGLVDEFELTNDHFEIIEK
ncbi:FAD:protein FMN transferase [Amphibacillus sp. MSJ-3]|uniref:FAD:protein FMN transferase n=1 Tax=Amphibacillus sp. MSJ-3 TaxID=2841505 RepID=UPI001C0EFD28|nr:FAD:protein FMN transferase [Amphibacillus sp. MSJ-3]MBU5595505.1 FAD:protein FMN transferase [Amphibacillus sp. MSJ-3]